MRAEVAPRGLRAERRAVKWVGLISRGGLVGPRSVGHKTPACAAVVRIPFAARTGFALLVRCGDRGGATPRAPSETRRQPWIPFG
jgi:hypothetical protein